jgi:Acetyltransferases
MEYIVCGTAHKAFIELAAELDAELAQRYGKAQEAHQPHNIVEQGEAAVALDNGLPAGCGCFRPYDAGSAEIKRIYVKPEYRGRGVAREVLRRLERRAAELGYRAAVLETGLGQPEAIRLYEKSGYARIPNYGPYADMPGSVCFRKSLFDPVNV